MPNLTERSVRDDVGGEPGPQRLLLTVEGLSKTFSGSKALDNVRLSVHAGEVVAVLGQNGSGKSTLVKILSGLTTTDPGGLVRFGQPDADQGADSGVPELHVIHQDLGLVGSLSTIENLDLARRRGVRTLARFHLKQERQAATALLARFGADFDVTALVAELAPANQAIVAIVRALDGWSRPDNVLVLDEPTAALHQTEVDVLFAAVRKVAASGAGVIFISHRLDEVFALADRVVVLRDGAVVADRPVSELSEATLIHLIAGRRLEAIPFS